MDLQDGRAQAPMASAQPAGALAAEPSVESPGPGEYPPVPERAAQRLREALEASAFDWLGYGRFSYRQGAIASLGSLPICDNAEWAAPYFSERLYRIDPRLRRDRHGAAPAVWDLEDVIAALPWDGPMSGLAERFANAMREARIGSGVSLLLTHEGDASVCVAIHLMSRSPSRRWLADGAVAKAAALGLRLHEWIDPPAEDSALPLPEAAELTLLQRRILERVQRGHRDRDIALALDLSIHGLDHQLRLLRRHFGVRTRAQLAALTLRDGLSG